MFERNISEEEIEYLLTYGEVIEHYPNDTPDPSYLLFGMVDKRPLHVVVGLCLEAERSTIITLYEPDMRKFESDFKTRKKP